MDDTKLKENKIREQISILLICLVLVGSGALLIKNNGGSGPNNFIPGDEVVSTSVKSVGGAETSAGSSVNNTAPIAGKVNINTASLEDLDTLPGIGPVTAQAIIDYRQQNGVFKSIAEIDNVSGIGPSKYSQIKDLISI